MSHISRIWERVWNTRGAKRSKQLRGRSLRMESLEDRALLSVSPGMVDRPSSPDVVYCDTVENTSVAIDVPLLLSAVTEEGRKAANMSAATNGDEYPLDAPKNFRAVADGCSVTFTWDPVPGAVQYLVAYSYPYDPDDFVGGSDFCTETQLTLNLWPDAFIFAVIAFGRDYYATSSDLSDTITLTLPVSTLAAPENLSVKADGYDVTVTWDTVTNASGYRLCVSNDNGATWASVDCSETNWKSTLTADGTYLFKVQACGDNDRYIDSLLSDPVSIGIPLLTPLAAPKNLSGSSGILGES